MSSRQPFYWSRAGWQQPVRSTKSGSLASAHCMGAKLHRVSKSPHPVQHNGLGKQFSATALDSKKIGEFLSTFTQFCTTIIYTSILIHAHTYLILNPNPWIHIVGRISKLEGIGIRIWKGFITNKNFKPKVKRNLTQHLTWILPWVLDCRHIDWYKDWLGLQCRCL